MIQTVTGEIKGKDLGTVLMHEHISCASLSFCAAFGEKWLDRERVKALSVETLKKMKAERGLGLFVDATPIDVGRDVLLLKEEHQEVGGWSRVFLNLFHCKLLLVLHRKKLILKQP